MDIEYPSNVQEAQLEMEWLKEKLEKNLLDRLSILQKAETDKVLQSIIMDRCTNGYTENGVYTHGIVYFFEYFLYTQKTDKLPWLRNAFPFDTYKIPFSLFAKQKWFVLEIFESILEGMKSPEDREVKTNCFIEKSRQIGASWMILWIFLYWFLFWDMKFLVMSKRWDEIEWSDLKPLFGKLRFMIREIPSWMLPDQFDKNTGTLYNKSGSFTKSIGNGSIKAETAVPGSGRSDNYNAVLLDEMAFMAYASEVNWGLSSATPCRLFTSTPNGESGEYYQMKLDAEAGKHKKIRMDWWAIPYYNQAWYNLEKATNAPEKVAAELDINYNAAVKWRVYPNFKDPYVSFWDTDEYDYDPNLPIFISMDNSHGGNDPYAIIISQTEYKTDKIRIIDSIQFLGKTQTSFVASVMAKQPTQTYEAIDDYVLEFINRYKNYHTWTFISDPYDTNSAMLDTSIAKEFAKYGIILNTPTPIRWEMWNIVEQIRIANNNIHRFKVHNRNKWFIMSIQNSKYPEKSELSQSTSTSTKPVHDQFSHFRTAFEYLILYMEEYIKPTKKNTLQQAPKIVFNWMTGMYETITK